MVRITEIAPEIYRISVFVPEINLEFSHFSSGTRSRCCSTQGCGGCFLSCGRRSHG